MQVMWDRLTTPFARFQSAPNVNKLIIHKLHFRQISTFLRFLGNLRSSRTGCKPQTPPIKKKQFPRWSKLAIICSLLEFRSRLRPAEFPIHYVTKANCTVFFEVQQLIVWVYFTVIIIKWSFKESIIIKLDDHYERTVRNKLKSECTFFS